MKTYSDLNGKDWHVSVNAATIRDVKETCNINLCEVLDEEGKLLTDLHQDHLLFVDVLASLLMDQIKERDMNAREFARAHGGNVLLSAMEAFREELFDFFPDPKARANLRALTKKAIQIASILSDRAARQIEDLNAESLAESVISSSSNSQPSPE